MGLRSLMSKASLLAGLAMSQTQTALAHALSYELTLNENLPHGHACAVWLPMVMDLACAHDARVRQDMAVVFGSEFPQAIDQLTTWLQALDISPRDLRQTPAGQEELHKALSSARGRNFIGSSI
jgi:alcohol dehydrogenase class IV